MDLKILIKGGGELASACAHKLFNSGFKICLTEIAGPMAINRGTSFCEAIWENTKEIEGVTSKFVNDPGKIQEAWNLGLIPIIIDAGSEVRKYMDFDVFRK